MLISEELLNLESSTANALCTTMNVVAACSRAIFSIADAMSAPNENSYEAPCIVGRGGRGRSSGSANCSGAPANSVVQ
ncbi:unannotated protein [freshwater metagenome]|uniref:Unannotated protein n=1 Tax=freshwater metagenome TaxID=449393 RepID=A0A6J7INM9_9ZZZZ